MIARSGCFGKSPNQRTVNPQPVLNAEGIAKASRNRTIFYRALGLIMKEFGLTREDALHWLGNDNDPAWKQQAEEFHD